MQHPTLTLEATVSALAPGGNGVAHVEHRGERRAVFIPDVVPGDRVRVTADLSSRPARGTLLELIASGPDRVPSPCPWSTACGGCDWMHLSAEAQARTRAEHVRAALPPAWRDVPIERTDAPQALAYRIRARVHVRCGRGGRVVAGMHEAGTHDPVEIETCAVLHPTLDRARRELPSLFEGCTGRGDVQIAIGRGGLPVYDVRWGGGLPDAFFARVERAVIGKSLAGARVLVDGAKRPADVGDPTPWMAGPDGKPLQLAPGGLGQANEAVNASLARHVAALALEGRPKKVVELYAGAGNLSVLLATMGADLVCVEASREGCDAARANLDSRGLTARVTEADADSYVWKPSTDLVVLDPPRTGARAAAERLAASRVARVVYVSCDAPTLGRDLGLLAASYDLRSLATFDMFPQTRHVEIVALLARRTPGRTAGREPSTP
jgi:23S rRNA (uracil1939-C5)-methyltransferase